MIEHMILGDVRGKTLELGTLLMDCQQGEGRFVNFRPVPVSAAGENNGDPF